MICAGVASATSTPAGWTDDFEAAKKQAAAENKLLLVDFSGSDWCVWCKKLDKEVFAKPEFLKGVKKDFVLVMIDSPRDKSLLSETAARNNERLVKDYKIRGFPTVKILKADGRILDASSPHAEDPFVGLSAMKDSSVEFIARAWALTDNYWPVYFDINKAIYDTLPEKGISFPFPQMDVHIKNQ